MISSGVIFASFSDIIIGSELGALSAEILAAGSVGGIVGLAIGFNVVFTIMYPDIGVPANLEEIPGIGPLLGIYSLQSIIRGQGEPLTPERLKASYYGAASFLMSITESYDDELYAALIDPKTAQHRTSEYVRKNNNPPVPITPIPGDEDTFLNNLYNWSKDKINSGINEYKAGNYLKGTVDITKGTGGICIWGALIIKKLWPDVGNNG